jgi:hypothetical protein
MGTDLEHPLRRPVVIVLGSLLLICGLWAGWMRLPPPQLRLDDEQVVKTVDALFTALTTRDSGRVAQCEQRLQTYHAQGRISKGVTASLDKIIQQARDGDWEPASRSLYHFIERQHRTSLARLKN